MLIVVGGGKEELGDDVAIVYVAFNEEMFNVLGARLIVVEVFDSEYNEVVSDDCIVGW